MNITPFLSTCNYTLSVTPTKQYWVNPTKVWSDFNPTSRQSQLPNVEARRNVTTLPLPSLCRIGSHHSEHQVKTASASLRLHIPLSRPHSGTRTKLHGTTDNTITARGIDSIPKCFKCGCSGMQPVTAVIRP